MYTDIYHLYLNSQRPFPQDVLNVLWSAVKRLWNTSFTPCLTSRLLWVLTQRESWDQQTMVWLPSGMPFGMNSALVAFGTLKICCCFFFFAGLMMIYLAFELQLNNFFFFSPGNINHVSSPPFLWRKLCKRGQFLIFSLSLLIGY